MTLTLNLTPETEAALADKARQAGVALPDFVADVLARFVGVVDTPAPITAASVRGKYARPNGPTVEDFLAERRAESQNEEAKYQAHVTKNERQVA